jgi:rhomboid protease GluP
LQGESEDEWVEVRRLGTQAEAEQSALVLVAVGIACQLVATGGRVALRVPVREAPRARHELAAYARENARWGGPRLRPFGKGVEGALIYCAVLVFIDAAARRHAFSQDWLSAGQAQSGLIGEGQWWRAVTALGLHADFEHLASNLAAGSLFGIFVAQLFGAGLAWLAILAAGLLGNLLNALAHSAGHTAIGASTAVFGALGLLAGSMWQRQAPDWRQRLRQWTPLAAGAMLLAFLGVGGERTDVGAHFAGFLVGCALGAGLYVARPSLPHGGRAQLFYGGLALALFVGSWLLAFAADRADF